ncbi:hypothetical protein ACS0PU_005997 [Formica fusca]
MGNLVTRFARSFLSCSCTRHRRRGITWRQAPGAKNTLRGEAASPPTSPSCERTVRHTDCTHRVRAHTPGIHGEICDVLDHFSNDKEYVRFAQGKLDRRKGSRLPP